MKTRKGAYIPSKKPNNKTCDKMLQNSAGQCATLLQGNEIILLLRTVPQ